jgi:undecaprenyl-diphosphatase
MILFGTPAHRGHVLIALSITVVNIALFQLFKVTFSRPRPTLVRADLWTRVTDEYSFPSGHTTIAFGIAWAVALLYPRLYFQLPAMFGAVTIGVSRVYLREHYPLDVIGGALLGSVVAFYLMPSLSTLLL